MKIICDSLYERVKFLVSDTDNSKTMYGNLGRDSNVALDMIMFFGIFARKNFQENLVCIPKRHLIFFFK